MDDGEAPQPQTGVGRKAAVADSGCVGLSIFGALFVGMLLVFALASPQSLNTPELVASYRESVAGWGFMILTWFGLLGALGWASKLVGAAVVNVIAGVFFLALCVMAFFGA